MPFIYTLQYKKANGQIELSTREFAKDSILVGRSEVADIRLESPRVSLSHARFSIKDGNLTIVDLNSLSGTRVNNDIIGLQKVFNGDKITIGDSIFLVESGESTWNITEQREYIAQTGEDEFVDSTLSRLDLRRKLPSIALLSFLGFLIILSLFLVYPFSTGDMKLLSTGPIANVHSTIADDCSSCHKVPFERVPDSSCTTCHNVSEHSESIKDLHSKHSSLNFRCGTCHMEHNGAKGLIPKESQLCLSCHASLSTIHPDAESKDVTSFHAHPEFRITQHDSEKNKLRTILSDKESILDTNTLKLNHRVHLEADLSGPDGLVTLQCESCHQLSQDKKSFIPVGFKKDCQSCHELDFEELNTLIKVPHKEADAVYSSLRSQYALLFLNKDGSSERKTKDRNIPKGEYTRGVHAEYISSKVIDRAREMEDQVFNSLSCAVCHEVEKKTDIEQLTEEESQFKIINPETISHWMPGAVFNHRAHQNLDCTSCHEDAKTSELTSDVMLPGIKTCLECHHDTGKDARLESNCGMCHVYHEASPLDPENRMKLKPHE